MFTSVPHTSAFRPPLRGEESPRSGQSPRKDAGFSSGPPQKQRKRAQSNPNSTQRLTCGLLDTYRRSNPSFVYVGAIQNPRRVLTKDSRAAGNHGLDNKTCDLILTVGDVLSGASGGHKFRVLDMLGQGTFGQVVKCRAEWDSERDEPSPVLSMNSPGTSPASSGVDELRSARKSPPFPQMVAVKVVKNKPAYFNQAKVEIKVLHKVGEELGPGRHPGDAGHSLIRLLYDFEYHHHLCLVFELMSVNLYELIKHQDFRGLPFARVRSFCEQLLDALECLFRLGVIHCDLKPENILLENFGDPANPRIKLIDLGSACYHDHVAFTYIQSRFYRAPEVLLGVKYSAPIDLWSLGCVAVELYMGLPVFPGVSAHNQLSRIVEMLGNPPNWMVDEGKKGETYFAPLSPSRGGESDTRQGSDVMEFDMREDYFSTNNSQRWKSTGGGNADEPSSKKHTSAADGASSAAASALRAYGPPPPTETPKWRLKTPQEWAFENGLRDGPEKTKRYVKEKSLPGVVLKCEAKRRPKNEPVENLLQPELECFIDFCYGLLSLDPNKRWTAAEAIRHPFIRQTKYEGPYVPTAAITPEPAPEETEEDLLFGSDRIGGGDLASDMAEMEMEVDDDEEEELEEEKRRIRTRAAPLAIAKSTSASTAASSSAGGNTAGLSSATSSLGRQGKSLGLSSSQQRYKRKLSESNSVAASPQTTASSFTSVLGSPITRPEVPQPMAHLARWSDLGLLASPKLGSLNFPYSLAPPPSDQLGSPAMATPGGTARAISYGSSLPNQRSLFLQATQGAGAQDVHAFRRLDFPAGGPGAAASAVSSNSGWGYPAQFPPIGVQMSPQQHQQQRRLSSLSNSTILEHMAMQQQAGMLQEQPGAASMLSLSWNSGGQLPMMATEEFSLSTKKRAESEGMLGTTSGLDLGPSVPMPDPLNPGAFTGNNAPNLLSPTSAENSMVVEKTLERWAPFVTHQQAQEQGSQEQPQQQQQEEEESKKPHS